MTQDELNRLVVSPESLNEETLPEIEKLLEAYPYSAPIIFLYLYNLALIRDVRYYSELQKWAVALPDREKLFAWVEMNEAIRKKEESLPEEAQDSFSLIHKFLDENGDGWDSVDRLGLAKESVSGDYFDMVQPQEEEFRPIGSESLSSVVSSLSDPQGEESEGDLLFSETLAGIYIKQGKYKKAHEMINTLSLNFPEKSTYFALQLDFLSKLIDNDNFNNQ